MTSCKMVEGSVHIAAERVAEALTAVEIAHGTAGQGMLELASEGWFSGSGGGLRIYDFYGDLDERADATLSALAPYVEQDSTLVRGASFEPQSDPVVREYAAGLSVGDQFAAHIRCIWERGFDDASEASPRQVRNWEHR